MTNATLSNTAGGWIVAGAKEKKSGTPALHIS